MSAGAHRIVGFTGTGVTGKIVRHLILLGTELFPVPSFFIFVEGEDLIQPRLAFKNS